MEQIKITFNTVDRKTKRIGLTTCNIFYQKAIYRFDNPQQAEITFKKMKEDGLKVLFSRGMIIQFFVGKNIEEIAKIIKEDAYKGAENTIGTKAKIDIENYKEERLK